MLWNTSSRQFISVLLKHTFYMVLHIFNLILNLLLHKYAVHIRWDHRTRYQSWKRKTQPTTHLSFSVWPIETQNIQHVPTVTPLSHSHICKTRAAPFLLPVMRELGSAVVCCCYCFYSVVFHCTLFDFIWAIGPSWWW